MRVLSEAASACAREGRAASLLDAGMTALLARAGVVAPLAHALDAPGEEEARVFLAAAECLRAAVAGEAKRAGRLATLWLPRARAIHAPFTRVDDLMIGRFLAVWTMGRVDLAEHILEEFRFGKTGHPVIDIARYLDLGAALVAVGRGSFGNALDLIERVEAAQRGRPGNGLGPLALAVRSYALARHREVDAALECLGRDDDELLGSLGFAEPFARLLLAMASVALGDAAEEGQSAAQVDALDRLARDRALPLFRVHAAWLRVVFEGPRPPLCRAG